MVYNSLHHTCPIFCMISHPSIIIKQDNFDVFDYILVTCIVNRAAKKLGADFCANSDFVLLQ